MVTPLPAPALAQPSAPDLTGRLGPSAFVPAILLDGSTVTGRFTSLGEGRLGL